MMNKTILVAVFVMVVVAVKQSYGAPMGKRTMTDALNSQLMSQSMSKLQGQALIEMLQKLQRKYGDFTIRTPGKRVTADAFMNEAMRNQYLRDQGAAFREALLALQARQGDFKVGKKSENDVQKRNGSEVLLSTMLNKILTDRLRDAARQAIRSSPVAQRAG